MHARGVTFYCENSCKKLAKVNYMNIVDHRLIYVVGGCTHQTRHLKELLSYNPVTSEWVGDLFFFFF